jgi:hypothetical protein
MNHFAKCCKTKQPVNAQQPTNERTKTRRIQANCVNSIEQLDAEEKSNESKQEATPTTAATEANALLAALARAKLALTSSYSFAVNTLESLNKRSKPPPVALVSIQNVQLVMMIDTGSSVNIINKETFNQLKPLPNLTPCTTATFGYGSSTPLEIEGSFKTQIKAKDATTVDEILVIKGRAINILGRAASEDLNLVRVICAR